MRIGRKKQKTGETDMTTTVKKKSTKSSGDSKIGLWLIGASFALVALVVGIIVFNEQRAASTPVAQPDVPVEWIDRTSLGSPEAPVVVQLWEDFLCPSCQAFSRGVKPQIVEEYVKSGQVRLEFHHFPLQQHAPGSFMAALGAECAADQNLFWPFHDKAFQVISSEQQGGATFEKLTEFATIAGLDVGQFQACLSGQQHQETITTSLTQAGQLGLSFTPSVIVDGTLLQDSSLANVKANIDAALAAKGQ
jgi:protein-disulfide isomerase